MAKFCGNCGAASDDNANVCGNCGAPFAASKSGVGDIFAKIPGVNNINIKPEQKAQITKIAKIAVPAVAGLVVILILIFGIIVPNTGARGAVKQYFAAIQKCDAEKYIKYMPEMDQLDYKDNEDTSIEEEIEDLLSERQDGMEDEYGDNVKYKIKVTKVDDLSKKKFKAIKETYKNNEDLDGIELDKAVEVDFDITIKGKDDDDEGDGSVIVIKEDGKWKVFEDTLELDL